MRASGPATTQPASPPRRLLAACAIAGLFGSPGIWLLQVIVSETLSASACYGISAPRAAPLWSGFDTWIFVIPVVALLLAASCAGLAWYGLILARRIAHEPDAHTQASAHRHEALRTPRQLRGDDLSRVRFIALCSAMVGTGFLVGVIFVWVAPWLVGPCGKWY
ncbi:hypothetical protein [Paraburkholderia acidisoli]|uniref:Uncharacterized protein n=1 Tax=Paraburkholderia acidisoli TaxID=2571748 RepID=A0A7Z2GST3_9BURK|nr:hypothetical protein [Paraburkholderia acidisoli]QGZ67049.1 hypothetical protein FAZ98_35050 [Paraburkholderia acidisoli]